MDLKIEDISENIIRKFTSLVREDTDECILFPCKQGVYRYPLQCVTSKRFGEKSQLAHRVSFVIFNDDLEEGEVVMHVCDNPHCINPKHLRKGSVADNNRDRAMKGRSSKEHIKQYISKGQKALREKNNFSFENVQEIRRLREEEGIPYYKIAEIFGVAKSYVIDLCNYKFRINE